MGLGGAGGGGGDESKTLAWGFAMAPHRLRALVLYSFIRFPPCILKLQRFKQLLRCFRQFLDNHLPLTSMEK